MIVIYTLNINLKQTLNKSEWNAMEVNTSEWIIKHVMIKLIFNDKVYKTLLLMEFPSGQI